MGLWKYSNPSNSGKFKLEIDVRELRLRLQTLSKQGNIEIVHLALQSMLDELEEQQTHIRK
jgi:hypothetical protein